nr:MAG TPA: hypothetical protein [Caudoviricetes sp.]
MVGFILTLLFFFLYVPRNSLFWIYIINVTNDLILYVKGSESYDNKRNERFRI